MTAELVKKSWNNCKGVYAASVVSCGPGCRLGEKFGSTGSSSSLVMSSHLSGLLSTFTQGESKADDDLPLVCLFEKVAMGFGFSSGIASEADASLGFRSELVANAGLGAESKLDAGMGSAEGLEMVSGVESAADNRFELVVGVESRVGLGVRLGFKGCLRGRPLRRGKVGAGLGVGAGVELWLAVGVASGAGSDIDMESLSVSPDDVGVGGLPPLGD